MVKPPVIVTRAEPGASETVARVREQGLSPILSPMLTLCPLNAVAPDLGGIYNLVFTSANGVRYFVDAVGGITEQVADVSAWCVGPATTAAAEDAGFQKIIAGDGNADDLARLILSSEDQGDGFLHVANDAAAGNLVATLKAAGRNARFLPLYETVPAQAFSEEASDALRSGEETIVLIHSAKAATAFVDLAMGLASEAWTMIAISEAAAAPLKPLGASRIIAADRPNEDALVAALCEASKGL